MTFVFFTTIILLKQRNFDRAVEQNVFINKIIVFGALLCFICKSIATKWYQKIKDKSLICITQLALVSSELFVMLR